MAQNEYAVRLEHVTKTFGPVVANKDVSLGVRRGEILALLGENGSGKTTLMNMIAGIYFPDEGEIYVGDKAVTIRSPRDALDLGIGMIHQHFKLVDVFSATENIALSMGGGEKFDLKKVHDKARAICEKYEFNLDLDQKVYEMSVSQKQTLEIVKVLYRGADILILDEPTAVLTPQETEKLFSVIRNMKADGKAVIIITHKLHEVLSISDRVAILRKGAYVGDIATKDADEAKLTEMMVGEKVELNIERPEPVDPVKRLDIEHLTVHSAEGVTVLDDASFPVYGGEILGIAGISGNGQKELLEAIAGLQPTESGASIEYYAPDAAAPVQLVGKSPKAIREAGIHLSFVPEDRLGMGLVGSMGMTDNMMLKSYGKGHSPIVDRKAPHDLAETIKKELGVVTPDLNTPVSRLSGGNVQKVLVGRELAADPVVLMTAYAVRGLDINTSYTIYHLLNEQKKRGVAVIYVGEDLDVLLELCDRIAGALRRQVSTVCWMAAQTTKEEVGLRMTNMVKEDTEHEPRLHRLRASRCCASPSARARRCPQKIARARHCYSAGAGRRCAVHLFRHRPEPAGRLRRHVAAAPSPHMTRFSWMLRDLSTLLCVGIALAPAFKMRFWNMRRRGSGADRRPDRRPHHGLSGQQPARCRCCSPPWRWAVSRRVRCGGFIPAWFKSRWNTNETLFTLMMNYVATSRSSPA